MVILRIFIKFVVPVTPLQYAVREFILNDFLHCPVQFLLVSLNNEYVIGSALRYYLGILPLCSHGVHCDKTPRTYLNVVQELLLDRYLIAIFINLLLS